MLAQVVERDQLLAVGTAEMDAGRRVAGATHRAPAWPESGWTVRYGFGMAPPQNTPKSGALRSLYGSGEVLEYVEVTSRADKSGRLKSPLLCQLSYPVGRQNLSVSR